MLTIVANIVAKPDQIALVKSELIRLIEPTRREEGCIKYHLHQDNNNPACFVFYETWASRALWRKHMEGHPIQQYLVNVEGAVDHSTLHEMTQVD